MLCSASTTAGRRLSASLTSLPLLGLLSLSPFSQLSSRSIQSRASGRALPNAGTYNSRKVRRAAEYGPPTGLPHKARQQRQEAEAKRARSYDNTWAPVDRQRHRQRVEEQADSKAHKQTMTGDSTARGESERQSAPRGRDGDGGRDRGDRDDRRGAMAGRRGAGAPARGHRRGLQAEAAVGDEMQRGRRLRDDEEDELIEEEPDDFTDRRTRGQRHSSASSAAPPRTHTSSRTPSARPQPGERARGGRTSDRYSNSNDTTRRSQSAPPTSHRAATDKSPHSTSNVTKQRKVTTPQSKPHSLPTQPPTSRPSPSKRSPPTAPPASPSPVLSTATAMADSVPGQSLQFDGETYAMQRVEHLSSPMLRSYTALSSETGIPIAPLPLSSTVALVVSPTGRLYMRWGAGSRKRSTHAVEAGFMLRAARKNYERGEAVKELPLVRALAYALPNDQPAEVGVVGASDRRKKRSATQDYLSGLVVLDATAGLCRDAAVALYAGAEVWAVERNPAIYALVRYDVERRMNEPTNAQERVKRLHSVLGDSLAMLRAMAAGDYAGAVPVPDAVLIDVWTDDNPHIDDFKDRQRARMLRHVDAAAAATRASQHSAGEDSSDHSAEAAEDESESEAADGAELVARREQLRQRERSLLAEARSAAKRCVVVKRLKSDASKAELLEAERAMGAVAVLRASMFEYVVYRSVREVVVDPVAEAAARSVVKGIDPVVDTSVDAAIAVAEQRRDV